MIVDVVHPVPVVHVPPRSRSPRLTYVATAVPTPVELRTLRDGEFRHVHDIAYLESRYGLHEFEGALWQRMDVQVENGLRRPLTPVEWTAWLSGRMDERDRTAWGLRYRFRISPLAHAVRDGREQRGGCGTTGSRGESMPEGRVGQVAMDGGERARAALAAYVATETVMTDNHVYRRHVPMAEEHNRAVDGLRHPELVPTGFQWGTLANPEMCPLNALDDVARRHGGAVGRRDDFERELDALRDHLVEGRDIASMANWLPGRLALYADFRLRNAHAPDSPGRGRVEGTLRRARDLAVWGDLGLADPRDARATVEWALGEVLAELNLREDWTPGSGDPPRDRAGRKLLHSAPEWAGFARHVEGALSRHAPAHMPEDDQAMEGLAP